MKLNEFIKNYSKINFYRNYYYTMIKTIATTMIAMLLYITIIKKYYDN